mmetsp:Transcript_37480/g.79503  ORF Transcript_37480/g.79503 Transcript_37480/m.79503 type:complete len:499 (+) Transcript_37480:135-1631(+)
MMAATAAIDVRTSASEGVCAIVDIMEEKWRSCLQQVEDKLLERLRSSLGRSEQRFSTEIDNQSKRSDELGLKLELFDARHEELSLRLERSERALEGASKLSEELHQELGRVTDAFHLDMRHLREEVDSKIQSGMDRINIDLQALSATAAHHASNVAKIEEQVASLDSDGFRGLIESRIADQQKRESSQLLNARAAAEAQVLKLEMTMETVQHRSDEALAELERILQETLRTLDERKEEEVQARLDARSAGEAFDREVNDCRAQLRTFVEEASALRQAGDDENRQRLREAFIEMQEVLDEQLAEADWRLRSELVNWRGSLGELQKTFVKCLQDWKVDVVCSAQLPDQALRAIQSASEVVGEAMWMAGNPNRVPPARPLGAASPVGSGGGSPPRRKAGRTSKSNPAGGRQQGKFAHFELAATRPTTSSQGRYNKMLSSAITAQAAANASLAAAAATNPALGVQQMRPYAPYSGGRAQQPPVGNEPLQRRSDGGGSPRVQH